MGEKAQRTEPDPDHPPFPPDIGGGDPPPDPDANAAPGDGSPDPDPNPAPSASDTELAELRGRVAQQDRAIAALLQGASTQGGDTPQRLEHPGQPPDPVADPAKWREYTAAMDAYNQQQIQDGVREQVEPIRQEMQEQALWTEFQRRYPHYAQHPDQVRAAFMAEGGVIGDDTEGLMTRVAKRLDDFRGGPPDPDASPDPAPDPDPNPKANRTSVRGRTGGDPPAPKKKDDEVVDLATDIEEMQTGSEWY